MIKSIKQNKAHKPLLKENSILKLKLEKSCELIKEANSMIKYLQATDDKNKQEIKELKKHWTHKLYNWFK